MMCSSSFDIVAFRLVIFSSFSKPDFVASSSSFFVILVYVSSLSFYLLVSDLFDDWSESFIFIALMQSRNYFSTSFKLSWLDTKLIPCPICSILMASCLELYSYSTKVLMSCSLLFWTVGLYCYFMVIFLSLFRELMGDLPVSLAVSRALALKKLNEAFILCLYLKTELFMLLMILIISSTILILVSCMKINLML